MRELSTEASASGAITKRSLSETDNGRTGGVGAPEADAAGCGGMLVADGVEAACCAERATEAPRVRRVTRGEGSSNV
eukprot:6172653-Pleurochrysis_carterae.AAC.1